MKKNVLIFVVMGMMFGCSLEEVQQWGDKCPSRDIDDFEQAQLAYIGTPECRIDNVRACDVSEMINKDVSVYFETKNCPYEYKHCVQDSDTLYHCEKETITKCADGQILCESRGGNFCLDPKSNQTCGASSCTDVGQTCLENSICEEFSEGEFACVNKQNNRIVCDKKEIDSSDDMTCGASNCDESDNYGGKDCSAFGEESFCGLNSQTKYYECKCPGSYVMCGGKCVNPNVDSAHCGAKGTCSSDDSADENYKGEDCSQDDDAFCAGGLCKCSAGGPWCIIEGMNDDKPRCYLPSENDTCNARLTEDGRHCDVEPCENQYACFNKSADTYECKLDSCKDGEQICMSGNDTVCYSLTDIHHCGNCSLDCDLHNYQNVVADKCVEKNGIYACTYKCTDGLTNCGDDTEPNCVDLSTTTLHCGACGNKCEGSTYCKDGNCINTECSDAQCTTTDANGNDICVNNDKQCGKDCSVCSMIHTNGYCVNGTCMIRSCLENEHPIFNDKGQITSCENNTNTSCAPSNITMSDEIADCTKKLTENVSETACSNAGRCIVASCEPGYHISSDLQKCVANSKTECAARNSSKVSDCTTIANSSKTRCEAGSCAVTECASGYHLSKQGNACAANTNTECGGTTTTATTNCTTLANIANTSSGTCDKSTGKCKVTKCKSEFHIKSDYTACEANSNSACGTTTSTPTNCTSKSLEKVCNSSGKCSCSVDDSTVLNYNGNACITKWCQGIPGVLSGEKQTRNVYSSGNEEGCKPTACVDGYKLDYEGENVRAYVCRPYTSKINCSTIGYAHATNSDGYCLACERGWSNCSSAQCASTHKFYADACLPLDACCGSRNADRGTPEYHMCTNCLALGKKCNASIGKCQ